MPSWAQRSASQVPGEEAFNADDDVLPVGRDGPEKGFGGRFHMPVEKDRPLLAPAPDVQGAGMQVDATIKLVRLGVEAPEVSSSSVGCVPNASSPTAVCRGGGLNKYQRTGADALQPCMFTSGDGGASQSLVTWT